MIVAVCLNPALDITYTVTQLRPGTSHRVRTVRRRAGGKGVNVAAVLHQQGFDTVVTGPVGGSTGAELAAGLDHAGIAHRLTPIASSVRQTVTIVTDDGDATVLNEPGPVLTDAEWAAFRADFGSMASTADVVTISGSMPGGVPADAYRQLVEIAHDAGTRVILDCDGAALRHALPAGPAIVKINEHEAGASTGLETDCLQGVLAAADELHASGAGEVVITRGAAGVVARTDRGRFTGSNAGTVSGNPTGAGDAFTAGLAASMATGCDWPQRLRRACSWAAAAVARPVAGELDPATAADHEARISIQEIAP